MTDSGIGDYFISDVDETLDEDDEFLAAPVIVPAQAQSAPVAPAMAATPAPAVQAPAPVLAPQPAPQPAPAAPIASAPVAAPAAGLAPPRPQAGVAAATREELLVRALDDLMEHSPDVHAAALVSLDGFTMASALPGDMQEDRVGAMSAAILGLGERAAAELGRGRLSQVFIEGADGYVLLMAAGERAVLTVLADPQAKLGLTLYDMRITANTIGDVLR